MSGNDQGDYYKKSVSIEPVKVDNNEATWKMTFDTKNWSFDRGRGGYYFILPKSLQVTKIVEGEKTDMESLPVTPELPNEKQPAYIQDTNYPGKPFQVQQSVLIEATSVTDKKIEWKVTFKSRDWAFYESIGGYYFIIPDGLKLTKLVDQSNTDILNHYKSEGAGGDEYRAFEKGKGEFDAQWGWSAGLMDNAIFNKWKEENRFSKILFRDYRRDVQTVTYKLETEIEKQSEKPFSLIAVIKKFNKYTHYIYGNQIASAAGLEVVAPRTEKVPKEKKKNEGKERKKDRSKKNRHSHKEHKKQYRTKELTGRKK